MTNWQDVAVAVIGAAIVIHAVYRIVRSIRDRKGFNPCDSCPQTGCRSRNNRGDTSECDGNINHEKNA